jgi:hypothetical protein
MGFPFQVKYRDNERDIEIVITSHRKLTPAELAQAVHTFRNGKRKLQNGKQYNFHYPVD